MIRRIVAVWVSLAMLLGFVVIVDVVMDIANPVKAATITVDDSGGADYLTIQEGIDAANPGDTVFVYNGTYYENVVVNKTINLTGEDRDNTIIDGGGIDDVVLISTDWVNITGLNISNSGDNSKAGLRLDYVQNCSVYLNTIFDNVYGIYLYYSSEILIEENIILNNTGGIQLTGSNMNYITFNNLSQNIGGGINFDSSNGNNITKNNISNGGVYSISVMNSKLNIFTANNISNYTLGVRFLFSDDNIFNDNNIFVENNGFYLQYSSGNIIKNNTMTNGGIFITGSSLEYWNTHFIDTSNTIRGKPIYYYKNQTGGLVPIGAGQVIITNSTNIIIDHQELNNVRAGVLIGFSTNNTINGSMVTNNTYGIYIYKSDNNNITNNTPLSYNGYAIYLDSSKGNIITNNNVINNSNYGIYIDKSHENTINGNNVSLHKWEGIHLKDSNRNYINDNICTNNDRGFYLDSSSDNIIKNNTAVKNGYGFYQRFSNVNTIKDNVITKSIWVGIVVGYSSKNNITYNNVSHNKDGISLVGSSDNNITGNTVSLNDRYGIYIGDSNSGSHSNDITNNNVSNNKYGIHLHYSNSNVLTQNRILYNTYGIDISFSKTSHISTNTMIEDGIFITGNGLALWNTHYIDTLNTVNGKPVYYIKNQTGGIVPLDAGQVILANCFDIVVENLNLTNTTVGIEIGFSSYNNITNNNASNNIHGIYLNKATLNNIKENTLLFNNISGIYNYYYSHENTIVENTIGNNYEGITLILSSSNYIYHNTINNNLNQAIDGQDNNFWDNGYPLGGNYWSDYSSVDNFKGPNQDNPGSDGIGDTNYSIDSDSVDNYPLMDPYIPKSLENYTILKQGWNLISTPVIQDNQDLSKVLEMIDGWYDAVQWHDPTALSDPWKHNRPGKPFGNDLFELNETMGFWIHITQPGDTVFLFNGTQPSVNQSIPLHPGWNMVGYPSLTNRNRTAALNNLTFGSEVDAIWTFNAATQTWEEIGPSDYFELGRGYWVHSKVTKVWDVPL